MRVLLQFLWAVCAVLALARQAVAAEADRPNIIVIMADDLGYADVGCYGCKDIPTPNIDQLAAEGVRFTSGYVTGNMCGPSRAGFLLHGKDIRAYMTGQSDESPHEVLYWHTEGDFKLIFERGKPHLY